MAFDRPILSIILLIQGIFAEHNAKATDGAEYIRKLLHKEHIEIEKPERLLFTAPYKICKNGCTGSYTRFNFGMAFPLLLGNYGKKLFKKLYPNDNRKADHLFSTRPTRAPFTTCSPYYEKVTHNRITKSTMYPGFVVDTKSTGFPGLEIRKTRSTGYHGYSEVTGTRSPAYHGYSEVTGTRSTAYHGYSEVTGTQSTAYHGYRQTLGTRVPDIEDFKNTRTRNSVYPDYAEFRNTRELDVMRNKPPRKNTIPDGYNQAKEDGADYSLKSEQEYTYRNLITPNSRASHSKKMRWLKMSMIQKTINNMIPSKLSLMRRLTPTTTFIREPKYRQDSINANLEERKRNKQLPF